MGVIIDGRRLSTIREVSTTDSEDDSEDDNENEVVRQQEQALSNNNKIETSAMSNRYAIKQVRKDLSSTNRVDTYIALENEVKVLSEFQHPNIIEIYGKGEKIENSNPSLLLEQISHTLHAQNKVWKKEKIALKRTFWYSASNKNMRSKLWKKRLAVAISLSHAISYLHNKNILFRDLKPENCGFDFNGVLKLFDFRLATRLTAEKRIALNQYKLTENVGTFGYMAPEVIQSLPYGTPADVYSFSIVLWEMLSLKTPFKNETRESHSRKICENHNHRPKIKSQWPHVLQQLLYECWSADASKRPSFNSITSYLAHCKLYNSSHT